MCVDDLIGSGEARNFFELSNECALVTINCHEELAIVRFRFFFYI